jgi:hypothetical protein
MLKWTTYKSIEEKCWRVNMDEMINERNTIVWYSEDGHGVYELHDTMPTECDQWKTYHNWSAVEYPTHEDAVKAAIHFYSKNIYEEIFG